MAFVKGKSGNPKGRVEGSVNKKTAAWNEIGEWVTGEGIELYKANLRSLMGSENEDIKLKAMDKFNAIIEFFRPKLARTELIGDDKKPLSIVTEFKIPKNDRE